MEIFLLNFSQYNCSASRDVQLCVTYSVKFFYRIVHVRNLNKSDISSGIGTHLENQFVRVGVYRDRNMIQRVRRMGVLDKEQYFEQSQALAPVPSLSENLPCSDQKCDAAIFEANIKPPEFKHSGGFNYYYNSISKASHLVP